MPPLYKGPAEVRRGWRRCNSSGLIFDADGRVIILYLGKRNGRRADRTAVNGGISQRFQLHDRLLADRCGLGDTQLKRRYGQQARRRDERAAANDATPQVSGTVGSNS